MTISSIPQTNGGPTTEKYENGALPNAIHPDFLPRLDEDFVQYYNKYFAWKPPTHEINVREIRSNPTKYNSPWERDYTGSSHIQDMQLLSHDGYEFKVRCYHPDAVKFGDGPYPLHVNFHGGGFVFGGLKGDAELCKLIQENVGVLVLDVDYRLMPEHTFGDGHEDAWAVVRWLRDHSQDINGDRDSISVGGISAGGAIAAVIQQLARDEDIPLKLAFLAVPTTQSFGDLTSPLKSPYPSIAENALAPCLNWARLAYFRDVAFPRDPRALEAIAALPEFYRSPINGNMKGLCPTFVATAELDPLRDEGEAYAEKLVEAGVKVTVRRYTGVPHPFMHMTPIQKAALYAEDYCEAVRSAHRKVDVEG
ncbi:hypothetical protein PV08_11682 [Exophiala spinifera]|uniref:Alpha/beta hydrolase fold-3 domain-containing protein n=1 Tax=Exophiala spinifera TaxID=91928 RepID=A0A0D1Y4Q1_9EURO|nr:uncharacterized protein PV08_11682 [Exophiala spinifera]KIW09906.1 hypothetical protein PV08_11682 [Exophiala spinifera]